MAIRRITKQNKNMTWTFDVCNRLGAIFLSSRSYYSLLSLRWVCGRKFDGSNRMYKTNIPSIRSNYVFFIIIAVATLQRMCARAKRCKWIFRDSFEPHPVSFGPNGFHVRQCATNKQNETNCQSALHVAMSHPDRVSFDELTLWIWIHAVLRVLQ